jgi:hypothetical protein
MELKRQDIFGLWNQIGEELGNEWTLKNPGYGFGICLEARGNQVLASLARPYGKKIDFNPTIRKFQPAKEKSDYEEIVIFPHVFAALVHHSEAFGWGSSESTQIINNPGTICVTIEAGQFRLTCPGGTGGFPSPGIQERAFEKPATLSFVLRHSEMAVVREIIPKCWAYVIPKHGRLLLDDMGLYFSFRVLKNLLDPELSAFAFEFPKYSAWAASGPIKIDMVDNMARLERSDLRAYCETRPIQDTFYENITTDQPTGLLHVRAGDVKSKLSRFDQYSVSLSLSEASAEATVEDMEGEKDNDETISPFGNYSGIPCKMKIGIKNLHKALNAGFCDFEVHRWLSDEYTQFYLLGKISVPQTEPRLVEGERRKHPTDVEVFIIALREITGPIEAENPGKEAAT